MVIKEGYNVGRCYMDMTGRGWWHSINLCQQVKGVLSQHRKSNFWNSCGITL